MNKVQVTNGHDPVRSAWLFCPNCSGPYVGTVSNQMADAMVETTTTQHLPETHWVRYYPLLHPYVIN